MKALFAVFLVALVIAGCRASSSDSKQPPIFTDITEQSGLAFVHEPAVEGSYFMPESMGSGGAFFDYDNDGDLDIYLVNGAWRNRNQDTPVTDRLFRQEANGTFSDVTQSAKLNDPGYGMGVAVGDIDNDGFPDVYVTNYGADSLYRNDGKGGFANIATRAGIDNKAWSTSAVFFDYDRDGYLDIYVANYVAYDPNIRCTDKAGRQDYCGPKGFSGSPDVLYRNNGDGTFTDVSVASKIAGASYRGLGVLSADFNRDSLPDLYVANDADPNLLWINRGDGTFEDQATVSGAAVNAMGQPEASMGLTVADVEGDQDLDLFMTHLRDEKNTFYRNDGTSGFTDQSWAAGLAGPSMPLTGFGAGFFDFDHDSDMDLAIVNGRVTRGPLLTSNKTHQYWDDYSEPNLLFENDGTGKFQPVPVKAGSFASTVENSRGLAFGDIDNDGDVDLLVTNEGGPARLYANDSNEKDAHWLVLRVLDPGLKRDAIGAEVTLVYAGKRQLRLVQAAYSYLCSNDPRVHFGLGAATAVDEIEVKWPDGSVEKFGGVPADRMITLRKGSGKPQ